MGQAKSKNSVPDVTLDPKVEIIGVKNLGYFGEVQVAKVEDTGAQLYVKKYNYYNKEEFEQQLAHCHLRQCNPHPNLINIVGYKSTHETAFCAEHFSITVYLEAVCGSLEEKLASHMEKGELISEVELQLLTEQLVCVLAEYQSKEISHGDIRPGTLFYNLEAYKFSDSGFDAINGGKVIFRNPAGDRSLCAPELLQVFQGETEEPTFNKYKADMFSLGATLLSLATLTKSEDLYNAETCEINEELLEARIKSAESVYSNYFTVFLRAALQVNPFNRPDFCQLVGRFTISGALSSYHLRNDTLAVYTPYIAVARDLLSAPELGGFYAVVEEKSRKSSHTSEPASPEKYNVNTQYTTPDGKLVKLSESRKASGEPAFLNETPLKSSQVVYGA